MATSNNMISLRRHDLDNMRTFLTSLVIVHHTALPYGGVGSPVFKSAIFPKPSPLLIAFNSVNNSFFMGTFFWLSGRMTAQSLARSSPARLVGAKVLRLGVPAIVYTLSIVPLTRLLALPSWDAASIRDSLGEYWDALNGVKGSAWYTSTLLIFDCIAAVLAWQSRLSPGGRDAANQLTQLSSFQLMEEWGWVATGLSGFVIRTRFHLGSASPPLNLNVSFLPQYLLAYSLGYLSFNAGQPLMRGPFFPTSKENSSGVSLRAAILISLASLPLVSVPTIYTTGFSKLSSRVISAVSGGWNTSALLYSLWNELSFALIAPRIMAYFHEHHNRPSQSSWWQPRYSYAAYLIHNLVSMGVAVNVESAFKNLVPSNGGAGNAFLRTLWTIVGPPALTAAVGAAEVYLSFVAGKWLVEHVPGLKNII
ncbi:hypothetical protein GQ53DRAFT_846298 [Thozetella sp. PMI_491]|nr:hypothetical protein GQ53DRAFT_846298 [Thozetella sp. PMI_491]